MTKSASAEIEFPSTEDFAAMLEESLKDQGRFEGKVVKGRIIAIESDFAIIDIGLKAEGRVPLREFGAGTAEAELSVGDEVEVFVDRVENSVGEAILSREKARREEAWVLLEKAYEAEEPVEGVIFGRVKGGFTVDLSGAVAFLPGSQVDVRPIRDVSPLFNKTEPFRILKMDRRRGNIVVSRRAILEGARAEQRSELLQNLKEDMVVEGVVKNVTDYGAFVDLGGIDGLLHVTDISWKRINNPSEVLSVGQTIKVRIIRLNPETQRISLGMKQLESDPWENVAAKYPIGEKLKGQVTNITDYGAFVELEDGVEGLVHVSEMSWVKKNIHPGKIVSTSQEVEVMVLEVDPERRRISLGLKQCAENPWASFSGKYPVGTEIEGEVKNITEFGLFIGLEDDVDGMVHLSDLDWERPGEIALAEYKKGEVVKAVVLDINTDKERISLGIKQLGGDPFAAIAAKKKGDTVTCSVSAVKDSGIEVTIGDSNIKSFIRRADLSRDRNDQRPDRFAQGEKLDAMITSIDKTGRKIGLSIKALQIKEEKAAVAQYGSSDSGASLGDILGAALKARQGAVDDKAAAEPGEGKEEKAKKTKSKKADAPKSALAKEAESVDEKPVKAKKSSAKSTSKSKKASADEKEPASKKPAAKKTKPKKDDKKAARKPAAKKNASQTAKSASKGEK